MVGQRPELLREKADRDLAESGGLPAVFIYPVLILCTGLATDLWGHHRLLVWCFTGLSATLGGVRYFFSRRLRTAPIPQLARLKRLYSGSVLAMASCWSAYAAWTVHLYGRSWSGLLALMMTVGVVANSTSNLTPYFPLLRSFVALMVLPSAVTMATHGSPSELLTASCLVLFCLFMNSAGRRHADRYTSLSKALLDLERSQLEQLELSLRWRSLVENAPEIILTLGPDHRIDFMNKGEGPYRPEDCLGQTLESFLVAQDREQVQTLIDEAFQENRAVVFEAEALDAENDDRAWYSCRVGPISQQGKVESVVVLCTNVTESRLKDQELRRSGEQLRRLTARQQALVEEERRHISREVHDELGQLLTALKIELSWLGNRLEDGPLLDRTVSMSGLVDTTISTVRRISSRLRPPLLDDLGPEAALDWLVQDACARASLEYTLNTTLGGRVLTEEQSLALFRVCQESLTNVARHAKATHVKVDLTVVEDRLVLTVCDDGIGISNDQVTASLGLLGLKERVTLLGGSVTIAGNPGQGTCVEAIIPLGTGEGLDRTDRTDPTSGGNFV